MTSPRLPQRFANVLSAGIWLVFLIYPAVVIASSPLPTAVVAGSLLAGFVAVYLWSFSRLPVNLGLPARAREGLRLAVLFLAVNIALTAALWVMSGLVAVSLLPFLVAQVCFQCPQRWSFGAVALALTTLALTWLFAPHAGPVLLGPAIGVTMVLLSSLLARREDRAARLATENAALTARHSERERIAADLHDTLGQSLSVISLKAQVAKKLAASDVPRATQELTELDDLARTSLRELREAVAALYAADFGEQLEAARLACASAGLRLSVDDRRTGPGDLGAAAAWILREAITNTIRHAKATAVEILLTDQAVEIRDNGCGSTPLAEGSGIRSMRARAAKAGLGCEITSDAAGTSVRVWKP